MRRNELRELATLRKAEIVYEEQERKEQEEKKMAKIVEETIERCYAKMETEAQKGNFYCEVEISTNDEVKRRIRVAMSEYSPGWTGDGYQKEYITLKWD
jgi:hypothetical protein